VLPAASHWKEFKKNPDNSLKNGFKHIFILETTLALDLPNWKWLLKLECHQIHSTIAVTLCWKCFLKLE
jgi:hypothetical protein